MKISKVFRGTMPPDPPRIRSCLRRSQGHVDIRTASVESLSNDDGNVNENVEKQWIKLQNTTIWPLFRLRLLETERENLNSRVLLRT